MSRFVASRVAFALVVMAAVSLFAFALMFLAGDPAPLFLPMDATHEEVRAFREAMGFDDPWYVQYARFLGRVLQGDLGTSLKHRRPAAELLVQRLPASLELAALGLAISVILAVPTGVLAAVRQNTLCDTAMRVGALLGQSVPPFLLGVLLILLFAATWRLFPASGSGGISHLILPGLSLGISHAAMTSRLLRSNLVEVLQADYVRVARAKGLGERRVLFKHALRNAAIPVVTVMGLQMGRLIAGAVITEQVFGYPGIGRLVIQAIGNRDFPVVQAFVLVMAAVIVGINFLVDVSYMIIDPRIRL